MSPLTEKLYEECVNTREEALVKMIEKTSLLLKENMTIKLLIAPNFQKGTVLKTSGNKIIINSEGGRTSVYDTRILFHDSSMELREQISISKFGGRVLVQSI